MCVFCNIVNKELPSYTIYEDHKVMAFLDVNPATNGHSLVIPKIHSKNLLEAEDIAYLMSVAQKIAIHIDEKLNPNGMRIISNIGEIAGQSVFHTHVHILPVYNSQDHLGQKANVSDDELKELCILLKGL